MSQIFEMDDDLRPEYDFTQLTVVARGQGRKQFTITVQLDPDVATIFPPIPSATSFPNAAERHLPLALFDPKHVALKIFDRIADAMEKLP